MNGERSFTVIGVQTNAGKKSSSNEGGRFVARTPREAASKAFSQTCRQSKIRGVCTLSVKLRETTQGSEGKIFSYRMKRSKLPKPKVVNGISYNYVNVISSMNGSMPMVKPVSKPKTKKLKSKSCKKSKSKSRSKKSCKCTKKRTKKRSKSVGSKRKSAPPGFLKLDMML